MEVSLCVASYRPGFDLLIESLKGIEFGGSWECIFADELFEHREKAVEEHKGDLPLKHVKAEPYEYTCPASSLNAAVRHAKGELLCIVGDYTIYPSDYLQKHWDFYKSHKDATLVSSYIDLEMPEIKEEPKVDDFSIFKEEIAIERFLKQPVVHPEERHQFVQGWLDSKRGHLNEEFVQGLIGIPRDLMIRINGFDEGAYNAGKGYSDRDLVHRAMLLGHRFVLDTDLRVYRCAHPHKEIEDLKFPFTEKKTYRTREENYNRFVEKAKALARKHILVNGHKGLRDLRWLNDRRILVQGGGAEVCTRKWVKILQHTGLDVLHNDMTGSFRFRNVSDIVIYGVSPFDFSWTEPFRDNCRIWFWFTGTDCFNVINNKFGMEIPKHDNYRFLAVSDRLKDELETVNIKAETTLDFEDDMPYDKMRQDMPEKFVVTVYMPGEIEEPYNFSLMKEVAEALPDITFNFFGNREPLNLPSNCIQSGYVLGDKKVRLYEDTSVYLRVTKWDGFPYINLEFQKLARHVISDYPYPFCHVAKTKEAIVDGILNIKENYTLPNYEGQKYYLEQFSKERFINEFVRIIYGEDCLKKWEGEE